MYSYKMADYDTEADRSQVTLTVRGRKDGKVITVKASESLKKMILSPNVSTDVKQLLINGLIHEQMSHSETNESATAPGPTEPVNSFQTGSLEPVNTVQTGSSTTTSFPESSDHEQTGTSVSNTKSLEETSSLNFKAWKENEEKLLIDTRHQMDNLFKRSRHHVVLWKQVSEKLLETLNCRVTYQQCMYKYNALKKKWKEVIDSPSGSETKHFTHKDEFDQLYGTTASTKPQYTIDTDKTERKRQQEHVFSEDDNTPMPTPPTKFFYLRINKRNDSILPTTLQRYIITKVGQVTLTVRGRKDGKVITVKASESLKKMILSPNVSPDVKQLLINGLIHEQMSHSETNESAIAPGPTEPVNSFQTGSLEPVNTVQTGSSTTTSFPESSDHGQTGTSVSNTKSLEETSSLNFKAWKENEEKLLIDTRHQMDNLFKRSRHHVVLWKQVSEKLLETLNCRVTYQQCMYKYNALKKKRKEVIDSPSGSETKHFTHKYEFDQLYGTTASTKPQYTIDTDKTERKRQQEHVSSEDDNTLMPTPPTKFFFLRINKRNDSILPTTLQRYIISKVGFVFKLLP